MALVDDFEKAGISFTQNEEIAGKTTFKVGGRVKLFVIPKNVRELKNTLNILQSYNSNFFVLGGGSNVVFPDDDFDCPVISTEKLNSVIIEEKSDSNSYTTKESLSDDKVLVTCLAGTPMASFVNFCSRNSLSGAEQFAGLPGSIGGALFMNARCFDKSICELIFSTQHLDYSNPQNVKIVNSDFNSAEWDYKLSPFQNKCRIITQATFLLTKKTADDRKKIEEACKFYINERVSKGHFKYPSAGSVFKNNHAFGKPSGKIIDEAGLKGYQIGGAQIAPFHGNFIINVNHSKAEDIKQLVEYTQKVIREKYDFELEPEIIFV